ncbi:alkaline phosphatase PafA [Robertkochia solimangrovi]|uniref:alkaline phosphatase PafA n=1 Tax=Robertkochia solimangrovi TaxID=2213046 RepID=UPI0011812DA7|nr:alkaline phosphatase PafA [Robertkochia solimangrovi]TRZ44267.1 alkaline phosphatase family protein [Robertkochia solimangrovi]
MKRFSSILILLLIPIISFSQSAPNQPNTKPKLVVGIVVDQMRYDYLTRYWERYGDGGFRRLVNEGFNCKNNHFNYIPTSTAPGHASVYTATTPAVHGIMGNDWFDKDLNEEVYCVRDLSYEPVGTKDKAGRMAPTRLISSTITDELKVATHGKGKVIGVAMKDRGAILPAGHAANAAYWFHGKDEGQFVSSSYYIKKLPDWVKEFNKSGIAKSYKKDWNTLYPIETYTASLADDLPYEEKFDGEDAPVFPHKLPKIWKKNDEYDMIKSSPYGNDLTADFALAAIEGEQLGADDITDFLAISFSSTDYVGHRFGVDAIETEDTYLRLDKQIERILTYLDTNIGKGNYTVFLTADHAAVHAPGYLRDLNLPAGYRSSKPMATRLKDFLSKKYGTDKLIRNYSNYQLYFNNEELAKIGVSSKELQGVVAEELIGYEGVQEVYTATQLWKNDYVQGFGYIVQNGFSKKRSGDVFIVQSPMFIGTSYEKGGTSHGTPYIYDTHVPLLFFGKGINQGYTTERTEIPDVSATIAALLGIGFPSGTTGTPVSQVID